MRILMTSYEFPPIGGGGAAVVAGLSRELAASGHEIDLVTMSFQDHPREEVVDGVRLYRVPCIRKAKHSCTTPEAFSYLAGAMPTIHRLLDKHRYDVAHAHFILPDGLLAWQAKRYSGLPVCDHRPRHRRARIQSRTVCGPRTRWCARSGRRSCTAPAG